jgi:hypothetical protein
MKGFNFISLLQLCRENSYKFSMLIFGLLFFSSCKKDDNNKSILMNGNLNLVKEIIYLDKQQIPYDTLKYLYNSNNQISEISNQHLNDFYTIKFDYEKSIITSNPFNSITTDTFKFNQDGTIAKYSLFENSFELEYNNEGYLISAKGHDRETSPREYYYEYENGNMVKIIGYLGGAYYTFIEYSNIPNKTNLTNIENDVLLSGSYFIGMIGKINKNLIKRVIHENFDTLNYEYILNADTLATKIIVNGITSSIINY